MKQIDPAGLDAYLVERDLGQPHSGKFFQGTVTGIRGKFPQLEVQVRRTAEPASDGHWHLCASSNYVPVLGDVVDLVQRDNTFAHVIAPLSPAAAARMPARHPYSCRLYWTGSLSLSSGWTAIGYNNVSYDPGGMGVAGTYVTIVVDGTYLMLVRAIGQASGAGIRITTGIWRTPVGGVAGQISEGSGLAQAAGGTSNDSLCVDSWQLKAGDTLTGYIWSNTAAVPLGSGPGINYMAVALLSQG